MCSAEGKDRLMYEYKVVTLTVKECESTFNQLAKEGWRVISVVPNHAAVGYEMAVTFEREIASD